MTVKHATRISLLSLLVAWGFDQLFWQKPLGVSFFIFVVLCLLAGALITRWESLRPAVASLLILPVVLFFAVVTFLRQEPFTQVLSVLLVMGALMVLAITWLGGKWLRYSLSDYFMGFIYLMGSALARPVSILFGRANPANGAGTPVSANGQVKAADSPAMAGSGIPVAETPALLGEAPALLRVERRPRPLWGILRGLLLALPVVALLAALLAAADPIFSKQVEQFLKFFRIENLGEYIFRMIYILIGAYLLIGVFLHAIGPSRAEKLIGVEKPWLAPFLGWLEAVIVLGAVDLLFLFFVIIQFRYFFGGQTNIHIDGYTFAEYARRGFCELVAVAVISLILFLGLSAVARRDSGQQRAVFSVLGIGLVALVATILVSAFQRLLLYEAAYGFSRLRTYTHVFMVWVGILLLVTVVVELLGKLRAFALAGVLVLVGFGLSISLINVDGFIVRQNVARAVAGWELDSGYLVGLSDDAAQVLVDEFNTASRSPALHDDIGAVLACRAAVAGQDKRVRPWPAYNWPYANARQLYALYQAQLAAYPVRDGGGQGGLVVKVHGAERSCEANRVID